jgi:hypothetical protein
MGGAGLYEVVLNERADGLCNEAADFIEQSLTPPVTADTVFEAIKHGDDEHRAWLREACDNLFAGKPAPPPRGTNSLTPPEGALTLDNASIQRLMDYGLLHHTNRGWIVGEWEDAVKADQSPPEGDTVSEGVVEAAYREAWHEGYATGDAGGAYSAVENDWLGSDARAALQSRVSPQAGMREALEEARVVLTAHGFGPHTAVIAQIDAALQSRVSPQAGMREALEIAIAALGSVNTRCFDRPESPLKPVGDIAREALAAICNRLGDTIYDELALAALSKAPIPMSEDAK